jgi:hypothetical protein
MTILIKVLVWYLALRLGDSGPASRPWMLGAIVGLAFLGADLLWGVPNPRTAVILAGGYVISGLGVMHVYYRAESIVLSLLVIAVGTALLFAGVPFFLPQILDR